MNNKIIFIGPCGGGNIPTNGASNKNYYLLNHLREKLGDVQCIDTEYWRKKPLLIVKLLWLILLNNKATYIISANNMSAYRLLSILTILPFSKRKLIYWVIGGTIADRIKSGEYRIRPYTKLDWILVEGKRMKNTLEECGLTQALVVPNFKDFDETICVQPKEKCNELVRFVFIARILPEKGVESILNACESLANLGGFQVDFYGPIDDNYRENFLSRIKNLSMVSYDGFLDLRNWENYKVLSGYDVMLFPTYWNGEGFPGTIIDAYIAGLPVIASDWSMNEELIEHEVTGWIIPPQDEMSLSNRMKQVICNRGCLGEMSLACQKQSVNYKVDKIISNELLAKII